MNSSPADSNLLARLAALSGARRDEEALALVLAHFRAASGTLHRLREGVLVFRLRAKGEPGASRLRCSQVCPPSGCDRSQ